MLSSIENLIGKYFWLKLGSKMTLELPDIGGAAELILCGCLCRDFVRKLPTVCLDVWRRKVSDGAADVVAFAVVGVGVRVVAVVDGVQVVVRSRCQQHLGGAAFVAGLHHLVGVVV